jgi:hypothetical protein
VGTIGWSPFLKAGPQRDWQPAPHRRLRQPPARCTILGMKMAHGRPVAVASGFLAFAVLLGAFISWQRLMALYHLRRLRAEPDYLLRILEKPEGTAERRAVRSFLTRQDGARALVSAYLSSYRAVYPEIAFSDKNLTWMVIGMWCVSSEENSGRWWDCVRRLQVDGSYTVEQSSQQPSMSSALFPAFAGLLGNVAKRKMTLPQYPSWTFQVLPVEEAYDLLHVTLGAPDTGYVCVMRRPSTTNAGPDGPEQVQVRVRDGADYVPEGDETKGGEE